MRYSLAFILIFVFQIAYSQDSNSDGGSDIVDIGTVDAAAGKLENVKTKMDSYDTKLEKVDTEVGTTAANVVETSFNVMGKLYNSYRKLLAQVEEVSTTIQTAHELYEIADDIADLFEILGKDGLSIEVSTLYDFDKYLSNEQQGAYLKSLVAIQEQIYSVQAWTGVLITNVKDGGVAMGDYERLMILKQLKYEIKTLAYDLRRLFFNYEVLAMVNFHNERNFIIKQSLFDPGNYNYTRIGGVKIGRTIDENKK